jgi:hypothetical protein
LPYFIGGTQNHLAIHPGLTSVTSLTKLPEGAAHIHLDDNALMAMPAIPAWSRPHRVKEYCSSDSEYDRALSIMLRYLSATQK